MWWTRRRRPRRNRNGAAHSVSGPARRQKLGGGPLVPCADPPRRTLRIPAFARKDSPVPRPVLIFTGQWTDLPLVDLAPRLQEWGYQGVELACWGDHFDVQRALG